MTQSQMADGKTSKMYEVEVCDNCGCLSGIWETKEVAECAFESDKPLTYPQVYEALENGHISPSAHCNGCENCCDREAEIEWSRNVMPAEVE